MSTDTIKATVRWSGEHWINYLHRSGDDIDSGSVSIYHTRYSSAGEGTVALVIIPEAGIDAIYTDNRELASWTYSEMIRGRGNQFDHEMPVIDATLSRGGDIRETPSWTIQAADTKLQSVWKITEPATVHWGPAPSGKKDVQIFSLLYFTWDTSLTVQGQSINGEPYSRDIWRTTIGEDRSSCVLALSETLLDLA